LPSTTRRDLWKNRSSLAHASVVGALQNRITALESQIDWLTQQLEGRRPEEKHSRYIRKTERENDEVSYLG